MSREVSRDHSNVEAVASDGLDDSDAAWLAAARRL
jgi:hypothetical protein